MMHLNSSLRLSKAYRTYVGTVAGPRELVELEEEEE